MWKIFHSCLAAVLIVNFGHAFAQEGDDRVQQAVNVIKSLCLAGKEYDISADVDGNITIKSFLPGASGRLSVNIKEADGAVVLRDELRIIGDREVRDCTKRHIGRVIDAIFEISPPSERSGEVSKDYTNVNRAKFIGALPGNLSIFGFVDKGEIFFYRFSVSEPIYLSISHDKIANNVRIYVQTKKSNITQAVMRGEGKELDGIFLTPRDYYISVTPNNAAATPYQLKIQGYKAE